MKSLKQQLKSEKGMATIETLPILIIFVMLIAYMFGSFGVIHTGILNSIAARTYAFETFRHRANLTYFRENRGSSATEHYANYGVRFHGIVSEKIQPGENFKSPQRAISMVMTTPLVNEKNASAHAKVEEIRDGQRVRETYAVNPVWVKIHYGICINAKCGD